MRKALQTLALIVVGALVARYYPVDEHAQVPDNAPNPSSQQSSSAEIDRLVERRESGRMVQVSGRVVKLLPDDNKGDRHQKFIVRIPSGGTVLVSHNIDIAPRIDALREGDEVNMYGQFEWNQRGGVLHWTHHAPRRDHAGGWIDHNGKRYE